MNPEKAVNRRNFIKLTLGSAVVIPTLTGALAQAGGHLPKLEESDAQAVSLGYKHDSSTVEAANYKEGSSCQSCALYQGKDGKEWGACGVFPGKEVSVNGWCTAYNPKA